MPDLFDLIRKWWKNILGVMVVALVVAGIFLFIKRNEYLSVTTALPASSFGADKSKIFSENIEALYSSLGTTDDVDMIVGTGQLDTIYLAIADQFNLWDHYKVAEKDESARHKAAQLLRKKSKVAKSEYGELKVKVWDTDKNLSPQLANAIMEKLSLIYQDLLGTSNNAALSSLQAGKEKIQHEIDSIHVFLTTALLDAKMSERVNAHLNTLSEQLLKYEKLSNEYQLMADSKPPALLVVEKARAATHPDRPRRIQGLIITAVLAFLFGLFAALALDTRKTRLRD